MTSAPSRDALFRQLCGSHRNQTFTSSADATIVVFSKINCLVLCYSLVLELRLPGPLLFFGLRVKTPGLCYSLVLGLIQLNWTKKACTDMQVLYFNISRDCILFHSDLF